MVVVAVTLVALVLAKSDYVGIPHVFQYCAFSPAWAEDLRQFHNEGSLGKFEDFRGNAIFSLGFTGGKAICEYSTS